MRGNRVNYELPATATASKDEAFSPAAVVCAMLSLIRLIDGMQAELGEMQRRLFWMDLSTGRWVPHEAASFPTQLEPELPEAAEQQVPDSRSHPQGLNDDPWHAFPALDPWSPQAAAEHERGQHDAATAPGIGWHSCSVDSWSSWPRWRSSRRHFSETTWEWDKASARWSSRPQENYKKHSRRRKRKRSKGNAAGTRSSQDKRVGGACHLDTGVLSSQRAWQPVSSNPARQAAATQRAQQPLASREAAGELVASRARCAKLCKVLAPCSARFEISRLERLRLAFTRLMKSTRFLEPAPPLQPATSVLESKASGSKNTKKQTSDMQAVALVKPPVVDASSSSLSASPAVTAAAGELALRQQQLQAAAQTLADTQKALEQARAEALEKKQELERSCGLTPSQMRKKQRKALAEKKR